MQLTLSGSLRLHESQKMHVVINCYPCSQAPPSHVIYQQAGKEPGDKVTTPNGSSYVYGECMQLHVNLSHV